MLISGEQKLIQHAANRFMLDSVLPHAKKWSSEHTIPRNVMDKMGELGFLGMLVGPQYNGSDIGYFCYALVIEEIAAGDASCSTVVSVHNSMACLPILKHGNEVQKGNYLTKLTTGKMIGAFALTEPGAGSDASNIQTKAERDGDYFVLNGTKQFITYGKSADIIIVFAKTSPERNKHGISAFIVPTDTPGMSVAKLEHKMGQDAAEAAQIVFENARVPASCLLGDMGEGYRIALANLEAGRIGIAAQAVGIARHALDEALRYAKERETFGKKICEHQAINFKLAEMATKLEAARNMVLSVAMSKDADKSSLKEAAMAKLFASETAEDICREAIQIFGGYGYLQDFIVEQLYRDVRVCTLYEGTSEIQKLIIGREILK